YIGKIISRRMKNQGMSWKRLGAEAMVKILMLSHNEILKTRLNDKSYKIKNPIKKLKYRERVFKRNWNDWLQASRPVIYGPCSGKNWVKGIKSIATI
ncbi:MAG TPA: ISLre2 family transposase, partial [Halanaerobiales bacterium]|nr:ISLre2 family transposase [Halanaerobiales bacterium]